MAISTHALKGYILEEISAYLNSRTEYKLLVEPHQDSQDLGRCGSAPVVKGRDANQS